MLVSYSFRSKFVLEVILEHTKEIANKYEQANCYYQVENHVARVLKFLNAGLSR